MTRRLDEDEKGTRKVRTLGGNQEMNMISESGLYASILGSNKPEAKPFRKWITGEVLPSIRKTGHYVAESTAAPKALPKSKLALPGCLTLEQQDEIKALVRSRAESLPDRAKWGGAAMRLWGAVKSHFGCGYKQIPEGHFSEVLSLIARVELKGEAKQPEPPDFRVLLTVRGGTVTDSRSFPIGENLYGIDEVRSVMEGRGYTLVPNTAIEAIKQAADFLNR